MRESKESNQNEVKQLSIEECKSVFFDETALLMPQRTLFRLNRYKNGRYYYSYDEKGDPIFYISVTNFIQQTMPTSPHLIKWIADKGIEEAENYKDERADYGTLMHILFQEFLIFKKIDLDSLDERVRDYCIETQNFGKDEEWAEDLKSDVLAFVQFCIDKTVQPVFIELVLGSDEDGYAGAVDLGCYMDVEVKGFHGELYKSGAQKGKPKETKMIKRVFAIVDFKSGRKGFFENNEIQLKAYEKLVRVNFPKLENEEIRLFNFSPKNWRSEPSYNLKDQTNSPNADKLPYLTELAKVQHAKREKTVVLKSGVIDFSKEGIKSIDKNYKTIDFAEYLKADNQKKKEAKNKDDAAK